MIRRNYHFYGRGFNILFGLCEIADGLVRVVSLGYLHTHLTVTLSKKAQGKYIARQKKLFEEMKERLDGE